MAKIMEPQFNQLALISLLKKHFSMNLARIKCLSMFIVALIDAKSVNLSRVVTFFSSKASPDSRYKRLKRFLVQIKFVPQHLSLILLEIMEISSTQKLTLILDRTNWKFGKKNCNILFLSVAHKGIAIPLFWTILTEQKQGNSTSNDRIEIIELFVSCFGKERIDCILGDREFIGKEWINWLKNEKINFVLRLKEKGQHISCSRGGMVKAEQLFYDLKINEFKTLGKCRISKTNSYRAYVTGLKLKNNELLVLIHSIFIENPSELYRSRWEIERLFKSIKKIEFDLEATHITKEHRLDTLISVLSISFCLVYRVGKAYIEVEKPKLKKHGYTPKSITHYGHNCLIEIIRQTAYAASDRFLKILNVLKNSLISDLFNQDLKIVP